MFHNYVCEIDIVETNVLILTLFHFDLDKTNNFTLQ